MQHEIDKIYQIDLTSIYADVSFNSRGLFNPDTCKSLSQDIEQKGLIHPILLRERPEEELTCQPDRPYALVTGFRRFEAFKLLKRDSIPATFKDLNIKDAFLLNISENLERLDISLEREVMLVSELLEKGFTKSEICKSLNKKPYWISTRASISRLNDRIKSLVFSGEIPISLAIDISREYGPGLQEITLDKFVELEEKRLDKLSRKIKAGYNKSPSADIRIFKGCKAVKLSSYFSSKLGQNNLLSDLINLLTYSLSYEDFLDILKKRYPAINWSDFTCVFEKEMRKK